MNTLDKEQRLTIHFEKGKFNLKELSRMFWKDMLRSINTQIISENKSTHCTSFILSHSSLLIFESYFLLITCGSNKIELFVDKLFNNLKSVPVTSLSYQEQGFNEMEPQDESNFDAIAKKHLNNFNVSISHSKNMRASVFLSPVCTPMKSSNVSQIFMKGISKNALEKDFYKNLHSNAPSNFNSFTLHDHHFEPCGYSLNAIEGGDYFIIHVSPEDQVSYLSFETNALGPEALILATDWLKDSFSPEQFHINSIA